MKGQAIRTEAHVALLHSGLKQLLHFAELGLGRLAAHARFKAHHLYAQHGVGHKGGDVGAQGHAVKVIHVIPGVIPGDLLGDFAQYGLGDVLNPGKAINDRFLLSRLLGTKAGAQAAVTHQHGGGAVAHYLG